MKPSKPASFEGAGDAVYCLRYFSSVSSLPLLIRNTCPSGCRTCVSRTPHGVSVGGKVTSSLDETHSLSTSSTSSTHTDIHTPLSAASSPSCVNVVVLTP